jgi:hypothetical protein
MFNFDTEGWNSCKSFGDSDLSNISASSSSPSVVVGAVDVATLPLAVRANGSVLLS